MMIIIRISTVDAAHELTFRTTPDSNLTWSPDRVVLNAVKTLRNFRIRSSKCSSSRKASISCWKVFQVTSRRGNEWSFSVFAISRSKHQRKRDESNTTFSGLAESHFMAVESITYSFVHKLVQWTDITNFHTNLNETGRYPQRKLLGNDEKHSDMNPHRTFTPTKPSYTQKQALTPHELAFHKYHEKS